MAITLRLVTYITTDKQKERKMDEDNSPVADEPTQVADAPIETDSNTGDPEADLESIEIDLEALEAAEAKEETKDDESEDESEDDAAIEPEDEEAEVEEPEAEQPKELSDLDKKKAFNKQQAEQRIQERQQRAASLKDSQQQYVADAEDDKDLVDRQQRVELYDIRVEVNTNKLMNGYEKAIKDFEILSDSSPAVQAELNKALDDFQALYVTIDAYGNPREVRGDLYSYLQNKADSISNLTSLGVRKQEKSKSKEKSKTIVTPSRAPREPKVDPDLAAFDEEAYR